MTAVGGVDDNEQCRTPACPRAYRPSLSRSRCTRVPRRCLRTCTCPSPANGWTYVPSPRQHPPPPVITLTAQPSPALLIRNPLLMDASIPQWLQSRLYGPSRSQHEIVCPHSEGAAEPACPPRTERAAVGHDDVRVRQVDDGGSSVPSGTSTGTREEDSSINSRTDSGGAATSASDDYRITATPRTPQSRPKSRPTTPGRSRPTTPGGERSARERSRR